MIRVEDRAGLTATSEALASIGQTMEEAQAAFVQALAESAKHFPTLMAARLPVVRLTRWEAWRVRFWLEFGQPARAQRIILQAIDRWCEKWDVGRTR